MFLFFLFLTILQPYHELIGILHGVQKKGDQLKLLFVINKEIELPATAIPDEKLRRLTGRKIGIFNCGVEGYRVRKIK